ncbi:Imm50 family immunity protein [Micromonospora sp. SL1-18]|uniref:Imm50 family immunity protein n=1 Tax=Micromonospora sp. SL1-18 TaxID=3399128 RepID=UPI003A4D4E03
MLEWINALSNPQRVLAVYGATMPTLENVHIHEVCVDREGPTLRMRFDLSKIPTNPPQKWRRDGLDVVQLEIAFGGVSEIAIQQFSTDPVCDLKIQKDGSVYFSGESDSVRLAGVASTATVLRISAYANS